MLSPSGDKVKNSIPIFTIPSCFLFGVYSQMFAIFTLGHAIEAVRSQDYCEV